VSNLPEGTSAEKEAKEIMLRYEKWKQENFKIDFDDVLLIAYRLLQQHPSLLHTLQQKYTYLMVDEFQDINLLQYELVKLIAQPEQNLMVVGDDDQTIYSFNGARSEFILNFEQTYKTAELITLTINYRSTTAIVGLGNEIIRYNTERRRKTLLATKKSSVAPQYMRPSTADDEARQILQHILQEISQSERNYGDFAILYRAASNNRALLELLLLEDIPYIDYGEGQLLYEHWLIRPLIDHLRLTLDRRDFVAIESVVPSLYINREKGMEHIRRQEALLPKQGPLIHLLSLPGMETYQQEKLRERLDLIRFIHPLKPIQAIQHMRKQFYDTFIDTNEWNQLTQHRETLKEMLDELETSAERFDTIAQFLDFVDEVIAKREQHKVSTSPQQGNRIALMTIHKSKGLEFPVVFLICASEGSLPHSTALAEGQMKNTVGKKASAKSSEVALEEERRLAYVAVTRAKEELFISSPARHRGKKAEVSRFVLAAFNIAQAETKAVQSAALGRKPAIVRTESVPAWLCTKATCPAWARISTQAEASRATKECPLCKAPMEKGSRVVPR
ncbi:MAG: UvrD-helicase domain-containing protein, partial [Gorillibacterium sp.]|nr:UvrD-helicase domain-containing protein [Gorillibacterium sp.]